MPMGHEAHLSLQLSLNIKFEPIVRQKDFLAILGRGPRAFLNKKNIVYVEKHVYQVYWFHRPNSF